MDVFAQFDPGLDARHFHRGPVASDVWTRFLAVVRLAHAYRHWRDVERAAYGAALARRPADGTAHAGAGRHDTAEPAQEAASLKYAAAYRAAEALIDLYVTALAYPGSPSERLGEAARLAVRLDLRRDLWDHVRADWPALALASFDPAADLAAAPAAIAESWRQHHLDDP